MDHTHPTPALSSTTPEGKGISTQSICPNQTEVRSWFRLRMVRLRISRSYKTQTSDELLTYRRRSGLRIPREGPVWCNAPARPGPRRDVTRHPTLPRKVESPG